MTNPASITIPTAPKSVPMPTEFNFDRDFLLVLMHEPFYGGVSMSVTKRPDPKCKTAYVGVDPRSLEIVMGYSNEFFYGLTPDQRQGVIIHELMHIMNGHILDRAPANKNRAKLWNIATDLSINCAIGEDMLPDVCLFPGKAPKNCDDAAAAKLIASFPKFESADWYMAKLEEFQEQQQEKNGGDGEGGEYTIGIGNENGETMDGHASWGDVPDEIKDVIKEKIREMIGDGIKRVQKQGSWGNVPAHMQEYFAKFLNREVDWKSITKLFFGRCRSMDRQSTIKRVNRKAPYIFPGVKRTTVARFMFAIDQSGSMSDQEIAQAFAECAELSNEAEIDVYNFDTELDENSHKLWKRGKKFNWERTRCGGTDFECVQRFVNSPKNRGKWTGVIIYTDGYAAGMGAIVGAKVLWLITENGSMEVIRPGDLVVQMRKSKQAVLKR